jgi:hypothetical protein
LEGIRLPRGGDDHAPQSFADQARIAVANLTLGRQLKLATVPPEEDRYGRVRAQAFASDEWVQEELLKRGLARVNIAPDRIECAGGLYRAEARARAAQAGLWSSLAYAIRNPEDVTRDLGTFQIVEGKADYSWVKDGAVRVHLGGKRGSGLTIVILPDDLRVFRAMGVDPRGYAGRKVRVRGIIEDLSGPAITVANPVQVEVVQ